MLATRTESGCCKIGELPSASGEEKIEVWSRAAEDGSELLELVEYAWGSGLGWYVRKRLTLDAAQVGALNALLGSRIPAAPAPPAPGLRAHRATPRVQAEENVIRLLFSA